MFFWPRAGARLTTTYRYPKAPWLDRERSRLDLSLNGQFLQTLPMKSDSLLSRLVAKGESKSAMSTAHSILPDYALFGQNELLYFFDLNAADRGRCGGQIPTDVRVSIDPRSVLDLRGAYHATRLPNLALFASAGFPFTRSPDLSDTQVIVSPNPSAPEVEAFLALMGRFGDATGAPAYRLTVARSYQPDPYGGAKHVLIVGTTSMPGIDALFDGAPVELRNGRLALQESSLGARAMSLLRGDRMDDPSSINETLVSSESFAGLVSFRAPDHKDVVLAVLAARPDLLPGLAYSIQDQKLNAQIHGDLSILNNDGFQSFRLADQYWYGELPFWISVEYGFSRHPLILSILVIFAATIIGTVAHRVLKSRQNKRLGATSET
jgi:cellulose synthase (UDP-forming)